MSEMVILVDSQDQQVGTAEKMAAHQQGLLHRAFSVFVLKNTGADLEILMQQRKHDKYHCGGLWTNTCCSHPRQGEEVAQAGMRRLQEEMGLQIPLRVLNSFIYRAEFANGLIEHEYDYVLVGNYNNESININPEEVHDYSWMSLPALQSRLIAEPDLFTPWLQPALNVLQNYLAGKL